jgi:hypothetical protein
MAHNPKFLLATVGGRCVVKVAYQNLSIGVKRLIVFFATTKYGIVWAMNPLACEVEFGSSFAVHKYRQ